MGKVLILVIGLALASAGVLLLLWIMWQLWKRNEADMEPKAIEIPAQAPPPAPGLPPAEEKTKPEPAAKAKAKAEAEPAKPDDLKRLEGIGPKIASVLQAAGIATFAQLADTGVGRLRQILEDADPRLLSLADPTTWPDQAALAAGGEWDALKALQQELKGGRRR